MNVSVIIIAVGFGVLVAGFVWAIVTSSAPTVQPPAPKPPISYRRYRR